MRNAQNILDVAKLQPDFMGFIFYKESPRYVGDGFEIPEAFPSSISRVGVFVNEENEKVIALSGKHKLDYLQLHGKESVEQVKELNDLGLKIIKVFSVGDDFDFATAKHYQPYCQYFLFDTKGKYYGGNAKVFDWKLLTKYDQQVPFFLSGGISIENMYSINELQGMNLFALDVNSGVEISPGVKDVNRITRLTAIRQSALSGQTDIN